MEDEERGAQRTVSLQLPHTIEASVRERRSGAIPAGSARATDALVSLLRTRTPPFQTVLQPCT